MRQVAEAVNERLDHVSGGRYLLQYDRGKSAGDRKPGSRLAVKEC
ncbi:hypothetical protein AB0F17_11380 [Nonomuraea sp. NPDC026600]